MASNPKIKALIAEIDAARCRGQFSTARELAKKYQRKYFPDGSALEYVVVAEAQLHAVLSGKSDRAAYDLDDPSDASRQLAKSDIAIKREQVSDAISMLTQALSKGGENASGTLSKQAHVVLGWIDLLCGGANASTNALSRLGSCQYPELDSLTEDAGHYARVVWAMKQLLHAIAHIQNDDENSALSILDSASERISELSEEFVPLKLAGTSPSNNQFLKWSEELLYRHAVLSLRHKDEDKAHRSIKAYLKLVGDTPLDFAVTRKTTIYRLRLSNTILRHSPKCNARPLSGIISPSTSYTLPAELHSELQVHVPMYEKLVTQIQSFPKLAGAGETSIRRTAAILQAYEWWVLLESAVPPNGQPIGDAVDRHSRLIEALYRGTKHTYQSMKLLRYIAHTFTILVSFYGDNLTSDEKREGLAAADLYIFHWDKFLTAHVEQVRKRREDEKLSKLRDGSVNGSVHGVNVKAEEEPPIIVDRIEGETVADAVGIMLTAMRVSMLIANGDSEMLTKALEYGQRAIQHNEKHSAADRREGINSKIKQYVGLLYGELSLEVRDSQSRQTFQAKAIESLEDALKSVENVAGQRPIKRGAKDHASPWKLKYQIALQYAEIGEISQAINVLNESIKMNPIHVRSWNLLALLMSCRKDFDQALKVCTVGWKECVSVIGKPRAASIVNPGDHDSIAWDGADSTDKEELINFKLTQLALETSRFGSKVALETLQSLFSLFRRMFGNVGYEESNEAVTRRPSAEVNGDVRSGSPSRHSRKSTAQSGISSAFGSGSIPGPYRFRVYDLLICLWITASSLYRDLEQFDEAKGAIAEAEKLAEALAKIEVSSEKGINRIPIVSERNHSQSISSPQLNGSSRGRSRQSSAKSIRSKTERFQGEEHSYLAKWGPVEPNVRRVLADIAFESFMIKQAMLGRKQRLESSSEGINKYLSPVAQVERSRRRGTGRVDRAGVLSSAASISSYSSVDTSNGPLTTDAAVQNSSMLSQSPLSAAGGIPMGSSFYLSNSAASTFTVNDLTSTPAPPVPFTTSTSPVSMPVSKISGTSSQSFVDDFFLVTLIDDDHLPTRVHLGILYYEAGNDQLAGHWLERATKHSKARGANGGRAGIASFYGGSTALWGWEGWRWLGKCYARTNRMEQARQCMYFALQVERITPVRGFECIGRLF
ncbi:hypothetical protein BJ742DRAFT_369292 [Cladochytrium replicatum]|nr:hypothetical protein BJ742DRAFT_369292 [Cladochytrium replicatum]